MSEGTWYRTGLVSLANGSDLVAGVGTEFIANVLPGAIFFAPEGLYEVERAVSDTQLKLVEAYAGPTAAGTEFAIAPTQGAVVQATKQLQAFLSELGPLKQAWETGELDPKGLATKGVKNSVEDLPAIGNTPGDAWLVDGVLYMWTGSAWSNQGSTVTTPELEAVRDQTIAAKDAAQGIAANFGDVAGAVGAATEKAVAANASAVNAAAREAGALLAKTAAEAARDAAVIQPGLYATEAEGRAAVANGQAFKVQGTGDIAALEYRRTSSAASVLIASYPSAAKVTDLDQRAASRNAQAVVGTDADSGGVFFDDKGASLTGVLTVTRTMQIALENGKTLTVPTSVLPLNLTLATRQIVVLTADLTGATFVAPNLLYGGANGTGQNVTLMVVNRGAVSPGTTIVLGGTKTMPNEGNRLRWIPYFSAFDDLNGSELIRVSRANFAMTRRGDVQWNPITGVLSWSGALYFFKGAGKWRINAGSVALANGQALILTADATGATLTTPFGQADETVLGVIAVTDAAADFRDKKYFVLGHCALTSKLEWFSRYEALKPVLDAAAVQATAAQAVVQAAVVSVPIVAGVATIDCAAGNLFKLDLTANVTSIALTNSPPQGGQKVVRITQDPMTPRTVAWPTSFLWEGAAPAVSSTPGAFDVLRITTFDAGASWISELSKGRTLTLAEQVAALYARISDPSKPYVAFVEAFTQTSFNGVDSRAPTAAGIPTDSMGLIKLEYTVTGAAGATSLAINSGDQSKGTGTWGATIHHDDGTYGLYCVTNLAGGVCTLYPALRAATTAQQMRNTIDLEGGQHLVEPGFKALARRVWDCTKRDGYRMRYAARWEPNTGKKVDWTALNGYNMNFAAVENVNSILGGPGMAENFIGRDSPGFTVGAGYVGHAGKGTTQSFLVGGQTGMFEAFISRVRYTVALGGSVRVKLRADGALISDKVYTGFFRVLEPYPACAVLTMEVLFEDELQFYNIRIGTVTCWAYDRAQTWTDRVVGKNDKVVMYHTSWTTYYAVPAGTSNGQYGRELQALMQADGGTGTVVGKGQGGTRAEWGLANFDALVPPENPDVVVLHAYINDGNTYGNAGYNIWLMDLYKIILKCQAIGARVVCNMPTQMGNQPQSTRHGIWSTKIGAGLPIS